MYNDELTINDLHDVAEQLLDEKVNDLKITRVVNRRYSCVRFIEVATEKQELKAVAKTIKRAELFRSETQTIARASAIFAETDDIRIPYIGAHEPSRLLLMPMVDDPSIGYFCKLSRQDLTSIGQVRSKCKSLVAACYDAGKWLRAWHGSALGHEDVGSALTTYLADRQHLMKHLDIAARQHLCELVKSIGYGETCIPHGDFSALNILWNPAVLTVTDFGIEEWNRMTPWWDYVSFEITLTRTLRFSARGLGTWFSPVCRNGVTSFRSGYGRHGFDRRIELACRAVRHLVLYADDVRQGRSYKRRANWHMRELLCALDDAENEGLAVERH